MAANASVLALMGEEAEAGVFLCEPEARLVYTVSSRAARDM